MRIGSNMQQLRKAKKLSQGELAQAMTERGRPWHQNTVSRIELGKQELDSIGDLNALQGILGTEILDGTALAVGRENDSSKHLQIIDDATKELKNIKAGLEELEQATDRLLSVFGELGPRKRVSDFSPDDFVKVVTDLDPRTDPREVLGELKRALLEAYPEARKQSGNGID